MKTVESSKINQRYSKCTWATSFSDENDSEPQNVNSAAYEQVRKQENDWDGRKIEKNKTKKPLAVYHTGQCNITWVH